MLPNFLIVGAPKAGTTSLYHYLSNHPEVFMSDPKEVNFFSWEEIDKQGLYYKYFKVKTLEEYEKLFENVKDEKAIGEGSVSYLFYPQTPKKIKELLPDVKIIILLRKPLDRGYSHYLMDYRLGLVDLPYEDIVFKKVNHKYLDLYYQQYVELGLYYEQVKRYLEIFGKEQVKIYFQEDLKNNTDEVIEDLYNFLGISNIKIDTNKQHNAYTMPKNSFVKNLYRNNFVRGMASKLLPESLKEYISNKFFEKTKKPPINKKVKKYLLDIYNPDIEQLEKLLNKDLSQWKS